MYTGSQVSRKCNYCSSWMPNLVLCLTKWLNCNWIFINKHSGIHGDNHISCLSLIYIHLDNTLYPVTNSAFINIYIYIPNNHVIPTQDILQPIKLLHVTSSGNAIQDSFVYNYMYHTYKLIHISSIHYTKQILL